MRALKTRWVAALLMLGVLAPCVWLASEVKGDQVSIERRRRRRNRRPRNPFNKSEVRRTGFVAPGFAATVLSNRVFPPASDDAESTVAETRVQLTPTEAMNAVACDEPGGGRDDSTFPQCLNGLFFATVTVTRRVNLDGSPDATSPGCFQGEWQIREDLGGGEPGSVMARGTLDGVLGVAPSSPVDVECGPGIFAGTARGNGTTKACRGPICLTFRGEGLTFDDSAAEVAIGFGGIVGTAPGVVPLQ